MNEGSVGAGERGSGTSGQGEGPGETVAGGAAGAAVAGEFDLFAVAAGAGDLTATQRARLFDRGRAADPEVERDVRAIIGEVKGRGDEALREMALRFDRAELESLEVPRAAWEEALAGLDPAVRAALERAAANIAAFHRAQLPEPLEVETEPGVRLGRRADPLGRVGVYAPGGRAAYPSSVLMGVVPAKVARVGEVVVCSPAGPGGAPPATVLAACALAGADRVFAIGGAGAVAALALGTASVPRVDKIVGPGNAYVTEAKRQLTGVVAIDSPAGPSEVLIIADEDADPTLVAVELLAQAEHDPDAASVLVSTSAALCAAVAVEVERLLPEQPRASIIASALRERGALLTVATLAEAVAFAEAYAPEHLLVMTREPRTLLPSLRSAGTIFLGAPSSVAFGDYMTGANHVLPTAGLARAHAGLSTFDFVRWTTYQELTPAASAALSAGTATLADAEGLPAHGLAARLRGRVAGADISEGRAKRDVAGPGWSRVPTRAAYAALSPYDPGRTPCETDLSDNTNLFGPSPSVRGALRNAAGSVITRYPSVYATELTGALADLLDVAPENITTGCGSDDLIDSAVRAFAEPGDAVAYPDPTFGMVPIFARMNATRPVPVPLRPDLRLDTDALIATRARITYICRPNNPTGTNFDRAATERACREAAGLVLLDEAYADFAGNGFAGDDLVTFAVASDNTVVLRTLSKAYGMAGLRVGFAVGPAALIAEIEKSRGPYKISGIAEAAALQVLKSDLDWVRARVADVREARALLLEQLGRRGVEALDSAANFVLLRVDDAAAWNRALRSRGVAVRPFPALPRLGDCLRVSIGPWPQIERFLNAFDEVRKG